MNIMLMEVIRHLGLLIFTTNILIRLQTLQPAATETRLSARSYNDIIVIIIIIIIINCKWVCSRWQWYYNTQKTQNNIHTHSKQYTTHKITNTMHKRITGV